MRCFIGASVDRIAPRSPSQMIFQMSSVNRAPPDINKCLKKRQSFSPKIPQALVFLFQKDLQAVQITLVISATLQIGIDRHTEQSYQTYLKQEQPTLAITSSGWDTASFNKFKTCCIKVNTHSEASERVKGINI
jgi:hypothetical protein